MLKIRQIPTDSSVPDLLDFSPHCSILITSEGVREGSQVSEPYGLVLVGSSLLFSQNGSPLISNHTSPKIYGKGKKKNKSKPLPVPFL